jgi:hypothetical protein
MEDMAAGHHIGFHSRLGAQYASHVLSLRAGDGGGGLVPMFGNPAAACHKVSPRVLRAYQFIASPETLRGTLEASPRSVAFLGWIARYFFFAAFFAAFFAGAFLAAFLVAICLFSLSMVCIDPAIHLLQLKNV